MLCCSQSQNVFQHSGKVFEIVDINEIPGIEAPRPCYLFVDGKEAGTGVERNVFLIALFEKIGKKYLWAVALPLFILVLVLQSIQVEALFLLIMLLWILLIWVLVCCVCSNWCGR